MVDQSRRFGWPAPGLLLAAFAGLVIALPTAAEAAKYKPVAKASPATIEPGKLASGQTASGRSQQGASGGTADPVTGTIGAPGALGSKDCFVVRKRAFVPGTGYLVKRSTFCN